MKKIFCAFLTLLLILSLAACAGNGKPAPENSTEPTQESDEDFVWSREGYFADENDNLVSVFPSEDEEYPGWMVGCMLEEGMYGWYIQQEGRTLHGDLVAPYMNEEEPFIVTVSEEGEDGILLEIEGGNVYHCTPFDMPEAAFAVTVNTEGWGQIAYAAGSETPEFDDEYPSQSAYIGLEGPETYTFAAKPDEGWKFMKWTANGADYSKEPQITMEITEDTALIAVFGIAGTDETYVELDAVATLGELLGLPNYGVAAYEDKYIYAFEQDGMIYRAVAEMPADVSDALFEMEWDDEEYEERLAELISPLPVVSITNLSEGAPTQEEMDTLIGKTGKELFDDGWYNWGWNLDDMEFYMGRGAYSYVMTFEGEIGDAENFEEEDIYPLVVASVAFNGIGDPTALDD